MMSICDPSREAPNSSIPPDPRKSKLGQMNRRVAIMLPRPFTQKPTIGAITSVHTPQPSSAPTSDTVAVTIAVRMLTSAGRLKLRLRPISTSGKEMKGVAR